MKKSISIFLSFIILVVAFILSGCSTDKLPTDAFISEDLINKIEQDEDFKKVEQVGEVPKELRNVVENNLFHYVTAFEDRVLKAEMISSDEESRTVVYNVQMLDLYGNELASYTCQSDETYYVDTLTATSDGGFLFVLGFSDRTYGDNEWASEKGFASRVIKCGASGEVQFDTDFESVEGEALSYCFETDNKYYLFGTRETPETKTQGIFSPTDIYMTILDSKGKVIKTATIGGTDYDSLSIAKVNGDNFVLWCSSQSDDGDFSAENADGYPIGYVITVNSELEITEKKQLDSLNFSSDGIGKSNGRAIYPDDDLFNNFDAGSLSSYIEYEDFYLIVSENQTGVYEKTPEFISSIWYYTETVYSGYDYDGELLFRASVDSTPDYDARLNVLQNYSN